MAAEHLAIGVTALGRANYAREAYYAQAFFALSVGFERAAKLAIVVDHRLQYGAFPASKEVSRYGHGIKTLLVRLDEIAKRRGQSEQRLPHCPIHTSIIEILNDFADNLTRYYNLDLVTNSKSPANAAPERQWSERVVKPILGNYYKPQHKSRDEINATFSQSMFEGHISVLHHTETGQPLDTVYEASKATAVAKFVAPYVRMYVMQIIRFVVHLISSLECDAQRKQLEDIPGLSEFFVIFNQGDLYFRRRKRWSIYRS